MGDWSNKEERLTLAQAARIFKVHPATCYRWATKGVRGVRLSTFMIGGLRYTSRQACEDFVGACTVATDGEQPPAGVRTPRQRRKSADEAEKKLIAEGW